MPLSFNKQQPLAPKLVIEPAPTLPDLPPPEKQDNLPSHPYPTPALDTKPDPTLKANEPLPAPHFGDPDWHKAELHLANVKANIMRYLGQAEHNPGILLREMNFYNLEKEFRKGNLNQGLYNAIMALDMDAVPHVNNLKSLPDLKEWGV